MKLSNNILLSTGSLELTLEISDDASKEVAHAADHALTAVGSFLGILPCVITQVMQHSVGADDTNTSVLTATASTTIGDETVNITAHFSCAKSLDPIQADQIQAYLRILTGIPLNIVSEAITSEIVDDGITAVRDMQRVAPFGSGDGTIMDALKNLFGKDVEFEVVDLNHSTSFMRA